MSVSSAPFWNNIPMRLRTAKISGCDKVRKVLAEDDHLAPIRPDLRGDQLQQRRLAGAAGSHDGRDAAPPNREVQSRENGATVDGVMHVAHGDHHVIGSHR